MVSGKALTWQPVEQTPQLIGHSLYIMRGFSSHWPSCAQATHDSSVSVQLNVHTPHESGHSAVIESGFFSHSPSRALISEGRGGG